MPQFPDLRDCLHERIETVHRNANRPAPRARRTGGAAHFRLGHVGFLFLNQRLELFFAVCQVFDNQLNLGDVNDFARSLLGRFLEPASRLTLDGFLPSQSCEGHIPGGVLLGGILGTFWRSGCSLSYPWVSHSTSE